MKLLWLKPTKGENISIGRHKIAEKMKQRGHDVKVEEVSGFMALKAFTKWLFKDFDLIVGTTKSGGILGALLKFLRGRGLIVDHIDPMFKYREKHSKIRSNIVAFLQDLSIRYADHVMVAYSEELKRVKEINEESSLVPLGIEYGDFRNPSKVLIKKAKDLLLENDINLSKPTVMYVGGFSSRYNLDKLLDAMRKLDRYQLILIGGGENEKELRKKKRKENIDNVSFLGFYPNKLVPGFLHWGDVCVTLVNDLHQLKALEYAAAGKKIVAVKGELEKKFPKGIFYTSLNPAEISEKIKEAMNATVEEKIDVRSHDYQNIADIYEKAINKVLA